MQKLWLSAWRKGHRLSPTLLVIAQTLYAILEPTDPKLTSQPT